LEAGICVVYLHRNSATMSAFIYCLNSSTIRPTPILEKIRIAGAVGYKAIELWHDDIENYLANRGALKDISSAISDNGLEVPTTIYLKGWAEPDEVLRQSELENCKRRLDHAAVVGAVHVIASPPAGRCDRNFVAKRYAELLDLGLSMGVKPAFEYLGFVEDLNSIDSAIEIITKAEHPHASMVLDPFHCFRGGAGAESIAKLSASSIAISHFNDTPAFPAREQQHDLNRVMPGDGHLDLRHYLELLKQVGYRRWLSLELFSKKLWALDPYEVAKQGLEKMQTVAE
jgi:2-keto-myo-inositol isomerase